jgi:hypothetical protein
MARRLFWMAMQEIEDAVRTWPGAVDEIGPGNRTLRRNAGAQWAEAAGLAKFGQVRKLAGVHHGFAKAGIHAVDADDDHLLAKAAGALAPAAQPVAAAGQTRRHGDTACRFQECPSVRSLTTGSND